MNNNKYFYFVAGTGIGAILGMLFSPSSGQEMRNKLSTRAQEGMDTLSRKVDEGRRYVEESDLGKRTGETLRNAVEKGKNVVNLGKQRLNESIEAGKSRFNESLESDSEFQEPRDKDIRAI